MGETFHVTDAASLGVKLVQLRTQRGLTQRGAARDGSLNPGSLRVWELGLSLPSVPRLAVLGRFYGVTFTVGVDPSPAFDPDTAQPHEVLP